MHRAISGLFGLFHGVILSAKMHIKFHVICNTELEYRFIFCLSCHLRVFPCLFFLHFGQIFKAFDADYFNTFKLVRKMHEIIIGIKWKYWFGLQLRGQTRMNNETNGILRKTIPLQYFQWKFRWNHFFIEIRLLPLRPVGPMK